MIIQRYGCTIANPGSLSPFTVHEECICIRRLHGRASALWALGMATGIGKTGGEE